MHRIDLPDWAVERGRHMNSFNRIDAARTALLVIDLQKAFTLPEEVFGNEHACDILPNVNRLARAMRAAGAPVIFTRQTVTRAPPYAYPEWHYDASDPFVRRALESLTDGDPRHGLHDALEVEPGDIVMNKYRYSAFIRDSSDIETRLAALGVDTLIVTGTVTNVCCESTARDAYMLGYRVLFASDATAAKTDAEHNAALLNLRLNFADVKSTDALIALVEESAHERGPSLRQARA
jgi:nicotinamidase-related amidase